MNFLLLICVVALVEARPSLRAALIQPRIIGGSDAPGKGAWPWQLSMEYLGSHRCGAVLLSTTTAITAAHCTSGLAATSLLLKLGMFDRSINDQEQNVLVSSKQEEPNYGGGQPGFPNDIAKMTLSEPAIFNQYVRGIALPAAAGQDYMSSNCWITGWGVPTSIGGGVTQHLRQHNTRVIANSECATRMQGVGNAAVFPTHICLYDDDGGACNGDSGGPLSCESSVNASDWTVAGVTSWGVRDGDGCTPDYPSVYSRVSEFLSFIGTP